MTIFMSTGGTSDIDAALNERTEAMLIALVFFTGILIIGIIIIGFIDVFNDVYYNSKWTDIMYSLM